MQGEERKPRRGGPLPHVVSFVAGTFLLPSGLAIVLAVYRLLPKAYDEYSYRGEHDTRDMVVTLVIATIVFGLSIAAMVSKRFRRWIAFVVGVFTSPVTFWSLFAGAVALGIVSDCGHGRPLRLGGRPVPRRMRVGRRRRGALMDHVLGRMWANDAALEASSVGAFRKLAMQLRAHDASGELVAEAERSAEEEAAHAMGAAALARAHGIDCAPVFDDVPPLDAAELDLGRLAVESLVDGCLGESFSAALARRSCAQAVEPVAAHLRSIAPDEERHAELAWKVVAFAIERGGAAVRSEVVRAVARIAARKPPRALPDWVIARCPSEGRLSSAATRALFDEVRAGVVARAEEMST